MEMRISRRKPLTWWFSPWACAPSREAIETAEKIGITLSANQFVGTEAFQPVCTNLPGIFVCGGLTGPLDIGQSVTQATATLAEVGSVLEAESFAPAKEYPLPAENTEDPKTLLCLPPLPWNGSRAGQ